MESGTFSHNKRILNWIVKYSRDSALAKLILEEMSSRSIQEYISDIRECGVKTASVLFSSSLRNMNILIETYISGQTVDQMLRTNSSEKLAALRQLLLIYQRVSLHGNLCLDWNLKNFIYHDRDLYYIDFVPCIYKDKLRASKSDVLKDYIDTYLDSNITLLGIYYYTLKTLLNAMDREELGRFAIQLNVMFREVLGVKLDFSNGHEYGECVRGIHEYLGTDLSLDALQTKLDACSLEAKINDNFTKKYGSNLQI